MQSARYRLNQYHKAEKVKIGVAYFSKPPEPVQEPIAIDTAVTAMEQTAQAFWELSQIYKERGLKL
ncbi:hypothetical protein ABXJ76_04195 [Methylobacter sp. G7]|uniref:hypothetical protein n=1 Tax=Methylobacter sp. G7 TaxID=3230117 RepID=UPI003D808DFC